MNNKPKDIGELYQRSLKDLDLKEDLSEWPAIEVKVEKVKFLRFGWSYFNIYYASLIGITFLFSSGTMIDHFLLRKDAVYELPKTENLPLEEETKSISPAGNIPFNKKDNPSSYPNPSGEPEKINPKGKNEGTDFLNKGNNKSIDTSDTRKDTVDKLKDVVSDTSSNVLSDPKKNSQHKSKQPVYIIKRDTLLIIDSIKTNKGRKR